MERKSHVEPASVPGLGPSAGGSHRGHRRPDGWAAGRHLGRPCLRRRGRRRRRLAGGVPGRRQADGGHRRRPVALAARQPPSCPSATGPSCEPWSTSPAASRSCVGEPVSPRLRSRRSPAFGPPSRSCSPATTSQLEIGLFALLGVGGALTAVSGGRLLDRRPGLRWPATVIVAAALVASFGAIYRGGTSLVLLIVGVLVMDAGLSPGRGSRRSWSCATGLCTPAGASCFAGGWNDVSPNSSSPIQRRDDRHPALSCAKGAARSMSTAVPRRSEGSPAQGVTEKHPEGRGDRPVQQVDVDGGLVVMTEGADSPSTKQGSVSLAVVERHRGGVALARARTRRRPGARGVPRLGVAAGAMGSRPMSLP